MSGPLTTAHVRVNDVATGQPTPVRIRFTDAAGKYYAPLGRLTEFATGRNQDVGGNLMLGVKPYAYIDGTCEIPLPGGKLFVEIHKGPEYRPLRQEVDYVAGKLALRFGIERWTDWRPEGWYSGDTRAHFLPPHAALLEGAAEDLAVVNLLVTEAEAATPHGKKVPALPNVLAFSGQAPALERPGHLVAVNTFNTHPVLGSLSLLHCHRVVFPLSFGGPDGTDDWSLEDWCGQCHRKGGLVVWSQAWRHPEDFDYGEPLADLLLGQVDAFEIDYFEDSPFDVLADWYGLLDCGFALPAVGASGKDSNGVALGAVRTYAKLLPGEPLTYKGWIEAIRAGRTLVTNGPLLTLAVNGRGPGAVLRDVAAGDTVRVRAEASSIVPFDRLELVHNGTVIRSALASGSPSSAVLEVELPLTANGWLAARCRGDQQLAHRPAPQQVFAHTAPVYAQVQGAPFRPDPAKVERLLTQLDRMLEWVATKGRFSGDRGRDHLRHVFQSARRTLQQRLPSRG